MERPVPGVPAMNGGREALSPTGEGSVGQKVGQGGTMSLLGMTLIETRPGLEACRKSSSRRGVAVLAAGRDSEAFRGGVRSGDFIVEVNSTRIRSLQDLKKVLRQHDPHDPMFVFLLSEGGWRFTNLSFISGFP